jgi:hypothetical protein
MCDTFMKYNTQRIARERHRELQGYTVGDPLSAAQEKWNGDLYFASPFLSLQHAVS